MPGGTPGLRSREPHQGGRVARVRVRLEDGRSATVIPREAGLEPAPPIVWVPVQARQKGDGCWCIVSVGSARCHGLYFARRVSGESGASNRRSRGAWFSYRRPAYVYQQVFAEQNASNGTPEQCRRHDAVRKHGPETHQLENIPYRLPRRAGRHRRTAR